MDNFDDTMCDVVIDEKRQTIKSCVEGHLQSTKIRLPIPQNNANHNNNLGNGHLLMDIFVVGNHY